MTRLLAALLVLLAGLGAPTAGAGFRSPESLVRNVYAYYGDAVVRNSPAACRATPPPRANSSIRACRLRGFR